VRGIKQIVVNTVQGLGEWIRLFQDREDGGQPTSEEMERHLQELNSTIEGGGRVPSRMAGDLSSGEEQGYYKIVLFANRKDGTRQEVELEGIVFSAASISGSESVLRGLDNEELVGVRLVNYNGIYTLVDEETGDCIGELRRE